MAGTWISRKLVRQVVKVGAEAGNASTQKARAVEPLRENLRPRASKHCCRFSVELNTRLAEKHFVFTSCWLNRAVIDRNQWNGQALPLRQKDLSALLPHRERGCWQRQNNAMLLYMPKITLWADGPSHKCYSISGKRSRKNYNLLKAQVIKKSKIFF